MSESSIFVVYDNCKYPEMFYGGEESASLFAVEYPEEIYFYAELVPPGTEVLTYDEETLNKVFYSIYTTVQLTDQQITECITEMQNRGILFRERVRDNA